MRHVSNETDWHRMFDLFQRETDPNEKIELMKGLTGIRSTAILNKSVSIRDNVFQYVDSRFKIK